MHKLLDNVVTAAVLIGLVSCAYMSYYLRPWRWARFNRGRSHIPDDPFARIPLPDSGTKADAKKIEKVVA